MKARILSLIAAAAVAATSVFAATGGSDNAAGYSGLANGDNGGSGFSAWSTTGGGTSGSYIGDSAAQGFGDINTSGKAWGFWGNPSGGNYINATRGFSGGALSVGQTFSIDLAIAWRNGNKGIDIIGNGGVSIFNFNVGSDQYQVNGSDQGWSYDQTSIINISITATGAGTYDATVTRGAQSFSSSFANAGAGVTGFGLYVADTDAGNDLNNLFANNAAVVPEPSTLVLGAFGLLGLAVARRRLQK